MREPRKSLARMWAVAGVCLGLVLLTVAVIGAKDGNSGSGEYVLRVDAADLAAVTARHDLVVDRHDGDLYIVRDNHGRDEDALELELLDDVEVGGFERNRELILSETPPGLALNQSTSAILESLEDATLRLFAGETVLSLYVDQTSMQVIKVAAAHARQHTGAGIVAVIDTGVDPSHPALEGVLIPGYDFTRDQPGIPSEFADLTQSTSAILEQSTSAILERKDVTSLNQSTSAILESSASTVLQGLAPPDRPPAAFGHGTMTAGLVHRVAPTAGIMALKAFHGDGTSSLFDIVRAVYYAVDHGARVINMSFSLPLESRELKRALDYAESKGVICFASAGNEGLKTKVYPAAWSHAIGVGATSDSDTRSSFSNYGDDVFEVSAPGEALITTWPGQRYAAAWGTSFSTAIVSGAAALLVDPAIAPKSAQAVIEADVIDEALRQGKRLGKDLGKGRIDLDASAAYRDAFASVGGGLLAPGGDDDHDSIANDVELRFGLDAKRDDAAEDADGDGVTNAQEVAAGTHPRGLWTSYLAEGATSTFFKTVIAIANPAANATARVLLRLQTSGGAEVRQLVDVPARARRTVDVSSDLTELSHAEFSTVVESDVPVGVDRSMSWGTSAYGSGAERAMSSGPSETWYLAEGATHSGFDLFYLVQNPGVTEAIVDVSFLRPAPLAPVTITEVVPARSRRTIWVDQIAGLESTDVSGVVRVRNSVPILVERAMYLSRDGQPFVAGHEAAAVPAPSVRWFLAEGATGTYFDTFLLLANPDDRDADVRVTFLRPSGDPIVKRYAIGARSRFNVWVNLTDAGLADTAVSAVVDSLNGVPIVAERAMWWPRGEWIEAHDSSGATETGTTWILAEGEVGGPFDTETYVLIANTGPVAGSARVTVLFEDGTTMQSVITVPAQSRVNVPMRHDFPQTVDRRFATLVESLGLDPAPLIVERAMYANADGITWASGTNALATKLQ